MSRRLLSKKTRVLAIAIWTIRQYGRGLRCNLSTRSGPIVRCASRVHMCGNSRRLRLEAQYEESCGLFSVVAISVLYGLVRISAQP